MSDFYRQLQDLLDGGLTVAVATITATKGSTPRGVGTKMIVHPYGKHVGTVGGGCGEADVIRAGLDVIAGGEPRTVIVDLTEDISMQSLGVCGGILDVFITRWQPAPPAASPAAPVTPAAS
jgi:xanthine dehydrogenase accessory factor